MKTLASEIQDKECPVRIDFQSAAGHEVFSINFLRRQLLSRSTRRLLAWLVCGYFAVQLIVMLLLITTAGYANRRQEQLKNSILEQLPSHGRIEDVRSEMDALVKVAKNQMAQLTGVIQFRNERFSFAHKLAGIARTLPARTWITQITGNSGVRSLKIQASYLIDPKKPYQLPTKLWMDALKADPGFGRALKDLTLTQTSQTASGTAEICTFEFLAEWNEDAHAK